MTSDDEINCYDNTSATLTDKKTGKTVYSVNNIPLSTSQLGGGLQPVKKIEDNNTYTQANNIGNYEFYIKQPSVIIIKSNTKGSEDVASAWLDGNQNKYIWKGKGTNETVSNMYFVTAGKHTITCSCVGYLYYQKYEIFVMPIENYS